MERKWHKVWPVWAPKTIEVVKPVSEHIREWAKHTPNRTALTFYGTDITYEQLNSMIDRLARALLDLGVSKGDRVAIDMGNCPQFVISYFAVLRAGGVVVAVNPMFKAPELEYELNDAGAKILIVLDSLYPEVEKVRAGTQLKEVILSSMSDFLPDEPVLPLPEETKEEKRSFVDTIDFMDLLEKSDGPVCNVTDLKAELAVLQYTGGTTGTPKGAMITHHALASAFLGTMYWWHNREDDVSLGVTPFFHVMGQVTLMGAPLVSGGQVIILSRFIPKVAARAIERYKVTFWVAATPMVIGLLGLPDVKDYDFTSFRCITTGGASVPVELQKKLAEVAPRAVITEGYGLSETICQGGAVTPIHQYRPGYVGVPGPGSDVKIVDRETGTKELGPNEEGEIIIKSAAMMIGYWNKPEETREMLRDGWLYTGDTGLMDEDGYVKFLGRTRELIKCSGFSVFPADVEDLLFKHPAVKEAAVIGVTDPYRGESVKAFIVPKDEYRGKITDKELLDWCRDNMAAYKRPKFIEFRNELPKSAAGKLLRRILVEEEKEKEKTGAAVAQ